MTDLRSAMNDTRRPLSMIRLEEGLAREPKGYAYDVALLADGALCVAARAPLGHLADLARDLRAEPRTTALGWTLRSFCVEGGDFLHLSCGEETWSLRLRFEPSRKPSLGRYLSQITAACQSADLGVLPLTSDDMVAVMVTARDPGSRATSQPFLEPWTTIPRAAG